MPVASSGHVGTAALGRPGRAKLGYDHWLQLFCYCRHRRARFYYRSHQQTKALTEKDTIVLADFDNSTGDPVFDDTLKTALTVDLRAIAFLECRS